MVDVVDGMAVFSNVKVIDVVAYVKVIVVVVVLQLMLLLLLFQ